MVNYICHDMSKPHAHMYFRVISYIIAAFYPELFSTIMGLAYDMGVAGENKLWLISGTADLAPFLLSGEFIIPKVSAHMHNGLLLFPSLNWLTNYFLLIVHSFFFVDSSAAKAISGNGIIFCKGGIP